MQRQGLHRSRKDRVFGGVAGGIAQSLNADPAIIRLIFAILIIVGGGGILLYLILWIAIPEEPLEFFQETGMPGGLDHAGLSRAHRPVALEERHGGRVAHKDEAEGNSSAAEKGEPAAVTAATAHHI